jgi:hypothetical protein
VTCPECKNEMDAGYLYIRGAGGALFWGTKKGVTFYKREGLTQIHLDNVSATRPATQAVIPATKCGGCGIVSFKAFPARSWRTKHPEPL